MADHDLLASVLGVPRPAIQAATVQKRVSAGVYQVIDRAGRLTTATGSSSYPPGALVLVSAGRIIRGLRPTSFSV